MKQNDFQHNEHFENESPYSMYKLKPMCLYSGVQMKEIILKYRLETKKNVSQTKYN